MSRCTCTDGSGIARRASGDQLGCPAHRGLTAARLDRIAALAEESASVLRTDRWGCCYVHGIPACLELRGPSGAGDYGAALFVATGEPPARPVWELLGLLDPATVRALCEHARAGMAAAPEGGAA